MIGKFFTLERSEKHSKVCNTTTAVFTKLQRSTLHKPLICFTEQWTYIKSSAYQCGL